MHEQAASSASPFKPLPTEAKVIRCTCVANGRDPITEHPGAPCPNGRVEFLGRLEDMTEIVTRYGCASWDEFHAKHPFRASIYQLRAAWREAKSL